MKKLNNAYLFYIATILVLIVTCFMIFKAESDNYGISEDEVFSYFSSNSFGGWLEITTLKDQTWYDTTYFTDALVCTGKERFNLPMVWNNQAKDVHPPLFYMFLNFVCSFFPGKFSKWYALGLNMFFMILAGGCFFLLMQYWQKNRWISLFFTAVFLNSKFMIEQVLFLRMYVLLIIVSLLQTWYHLILFDKLSEKEFGWKESRKYYLYLGIITILGALTHYYFLVLQLLLAFVWISGMLIKEKKKSLAVISRYVITMVFSAVLYIVIYPAALNHLFFKYRGRDAVHKFLKTSSLFGDTIAMLKTLNETLFKGYLWYFMLAVAIGIILGLRQSKTNKEMIYKQVALILISIIYIYGISKASPYISLRYISPVVPILLVVMYSVVICAINIVFSSHIARNGAIALACLLMMCMNVFFQNTPIKSDRYLRERDILAELTKTVTKCVYLSGDEYQWRMEEDYVNYPLFEELFFIDAREKNPIQTTKLSKEEKVVVYVEHTLDLNETISYMKQYLPYKNYDVVFDEGYQYILLAE